GFKIDAARTPVWKRPCTTLASIGGGSAAVDESIVRIGDGTTTRRLGSDRLIQLDDSAFRIHLEGNRTEIARAGAEKSTWTQSFDQRGRTVPAADARRVVVATPGADGLLMVLEADSGKRVSMVPLGKRVGAAAISGSRVLAHAGDVLTAIETDSGQRVF